MNTDMNDDLSSAMSKLPEPAPPASLRATVMARIARDAETPRATTPQREQPLWLLAVAGLVVLLCASAYGWLNTRSLPDMTSPRIGQRLPLIPTEGPVALAIGLGLLIYMAGLMGPLRSGNRR